MREHLKQSGTFEELGHVWPLYASSEYSIEILNTIPRERVDPDALRDELLAVLEKYGLNEVVVKPVTVNFMLPKDRAELETLRGKVQ